MKKIILFLLSTLIALTCLTGCVKKDVRNDDIVVLFTNDIHCGIEDNITLAGVTYYKKLMEAKSKYVTLVDCGDHIQGSYLGAISKGDAIIETMNLVGYDYAILGNHEFDFGMEKLRSLIDKANAEYLLCNIKYTGTGENMLAHLKPYEIKEYGKTKVAFVGVSTPDSLVSSAPVNFMEDGKYVYQFSEGSNAKSFYDTIQKSVDDARNEGADYVVLLAHLGLATGNQLNIPYTSPNTIANLSGVDVVLDGHSHSTFTYYCQKDKDGKNVICAQTGTKLANLGQLVISKDGTITVSDISDIRDKDEMVESKIQEIINKYEDMLSYKIGSTNVDLTISDSAGIRMVRSRETNLGDLVADAFKESSGADIVYVNGGGVRETIKAGDITYKNVISVCPFGSMLCVIELTGQEVLDMYEYFVMDVQKEYMTKDHTASLGESGSFPQVSGIKFVVDTSIPSSVKVDDANNLLSVDGQRRLKEVMVLEGNRYFPIDLEKTYTVAMLDFTAKNGGCGMREFMKDKKMVLDGTIADYEAVIHYIQDVLHGDTSAYEKVQDRIIVK